MASKDSFGKPIHPKGSTEACDSMQEVPDQFLNNPAEVMFRDVLPEYDEGKKHIGITSNMSRKAVMKLEQRFVKLHVSDKEPGNVTEEAASPSQHYPGNDSDSDDGCINVVIPSIEKQRKFVEVATYITRLQKFQATMDKVGLGNLLWKGYVFDLEQAWTWARPTVKKHRGYLESGRQSGDRTQHEHSSRSRGRQEGHDQERNQITGREECIKWIEIREELSRNVEVGQGRGLVMNRGRVAVMNRGRKINVARGGGIETARDRETNMSQRRELNMRRET